MKSIIVNHPTHNMQFHILTDSISRKNREKLERISHPHKCEIYEIEDSRLNGLKVGRYTKYTWYRIYLPEVLDKKIKRILYLDADTLVANDISKLFEMDIKDKSVAASPDDWNHQKDRSFFDKIGIKDSSRYFCAGVLLMNLEYWREHNLLDQILSWAKENNDKLLFPDQDALNFVCQDSLMLLPRSYDVTFNQFIDEYLLTNNYEEVKESLLSPKIIHYCAMLPWFYESWHPLIILWRRYNNLLLKDNVKLSLKNKYNLMLWLKITLWHVFHPKHAETMYNDTKTWVIHRV